MIKEGRLSIPLKFALAVMFCCMVCRAQASAPAACKDIAASGLPASTLEAPPRHILGIFPNHNASPCLVPYTPLSVGEKFKIAREDALDPGAIAVAGLTGGAAQLFNSNRPFGQEASGYTRYFAAAYANHVIGDFLIEGLSDLTPPGSKIFSKGIWDRGRSREICREPGLSDSDGRWRNGI